MKNKLAIYITITALTTLISCRKTTEIANDFSCKSNSSTVLMENVTDFKNTFSINLPKHWNTKFYYDSSQSEIFSADTLKTIDETVVFNIAMVENNLKLDNHFTTNLKNITTANGLTTIKGNYANFQTYKGYYHLGKGVNKNLPIQVLQYYINCENNRYLRLKIEVYGNENVDKRLCKALSLIKTLHINKP